MIRPQFLFWWPNDKKSKKRKSKLKTISEALIFCFCVYHLRAHFGTPTDLIGPVLMRKEYIPFALGVLLESYQCRVETQLVRVRMFPLKKKTIWASLKKQTLFYYLLVVVSSKETVHLSETSQGSHEKNCLTFSIVTRNMSC